MIHAIDVARSQLGIQERTGRNDGIPAERYMNGDELAWCAGFVLWCNANSDDPDAARTLADAYRMRRVATFIDVMREREMWLPSSAPPLSNDFIFVDWQRDVGSPGLHVEIVESVGHAIATIGGNVSNRVKRSTWAPRDRRILGFGRVTMGAST